MEMSLSHRMTKHRRRIAAEHKAKLINDHKAYIQKRDEQWHKQAGLAAHRRLEALTQVHWSHYFNILEAIAGQPVWCAACKSKSVDIFHKLKDSGEMYEDKSSPKDWYQDPDPDWRKWEDTD